MIIAGQTGKEGSHCVLVGKEASQEQMTYPIIRLCPDSEGNLLFSTFPMYESAVSLGGRLLAPMKLSSSWYTRSRSLYRFLSPTSFLVFL